MHRKYGLEKKCLYCGSLFVTAPRMVDYCSQPCKNPRNRPGHSAWNKGLKMTEEFKQTKMNLSGLAKGWGWNKGLPNEKQKTKWSGEGNPNWGGGVSQQRKRTGSLSNPGPKNGMYGKIYSSESIEKMRQAKMQNYRDGVYKNKSTGECQLKEKLESRINDLIYQYTIPNYHRVYDFYIPSLNLIVEYDGDYWHREEKYLTKDYKDTTKALKEGFKVFRYWESTVKELGIDTIVEDIVKLEGKYCRILKEV